MTRSRRVWWKLAVGCFLAAVAWDYGYFWVLTRFDPEHRLFRYLSLEAPAWLRFLGRWTPSMMAARFLRIFGLRFDISHYDENTGYILIASGVEWLIWTLIFFAAIRGLEAIANRRTNVGETAAA